MHSHVGPSLREILGSQRGICLEQFGIRRAQPPRLFQQLNRNPGADGARLTTAHSGAAFNAGEVIPQIPLDGLEQLQLLRPRQRRQQVLELLEHGHHQCWLG